MSSVLNPLGSMGTNVTAAGTPYTSTDATGAQAYWNNFLAAAAAAGHPYPTEATINAWDAAHPNAAAKGKGNDPVTVWEDSLPSNLAQQYSTVESALSNGDVTGFTASGTPQISGTFYGQDTSGNFLNKYLPGASIAAASLTFGPELLGGAPLAGAEGAGVGSGVAAGAGDLATVGAPDLTGLAAPTLDSSALASTGAGAGGGFGGGAGGLADAGAIGSAPSAGVEAGAGDLAAVGSPDLTSIATPTLSSSAPSGLSSLSQYLPKNIISSGLQSAGVPAPIAGAAGGAVQGSAVSAITGGNPVTGALSGGISGGIGSSGIASGISNDVGGGAVGNAVGGAVQSAIGTGATDLVTGANPLNIATSAVGGAVGGATGQQAVGSLASQGAGAALSSGTTTSGGKMADPTNPMSGTPTNVAPTTLQASAPTATATQGLPAVSTPGLPTGTDATAATPAAVSGFNPDLSGAASAPSISGSTPTLPDSSTSSTAGSVGTDPVSAALTSVGTSILGGSGSSTSMAPYLAIGAVGLAEAASANSTAQQQAATVAALGTPYTQAGTTMLNNAMSGTLTPAQQSLVNSYTTAGNTILSNPANAALLTIATQAFGDYSSGTLPAGDQLALDQSVAAQKAQVRSQLAGMGITDSTILAAQDQQIDNNAAITKQQLLDQQFQTGNQAFTQYMQTTEQGQQDLIAGQQSAVTSLQTTLQDALSSGAQGSNDVIQAVQMQIASDAQIGTAVSDLLGNLAKAYAYTSYQNQQAAGKTGISTGQTGATGGVSTPGISAPSSPGSMSLPTTGQNAVATGTQDLNNLNTPSSVSPTSVGMTSSDVTDPTTGLPYNSTPIETSGSTMPNIGSSYTSGSTYNDATGTTTPVLNPGTASQQDLVSYIAGTT
jgi:hypothetical protein